MAGSRRNWVVQRGSDCDEVAIDQSLRAAVEDDDDFGLTDHVARHVEQALRDANLPRPPRESAVRKRLELEFRETLFKLSDLALKRQEGDWTAISDGAPREELPVERAWRELPKHDGGLTALFEKYAEDKRLNDGDTRSVRKTEDA